MALGTGQALDTARRGDADVVFVHAKSEEDRFLAEGFGVKRYPVMYNDFVLIGPRTDPGGVGQSGDILAALRKIRDKELPFVSRGDRSGTHVAEIKLWKEAGIDIADARGSWYKSIGQGMGAALNTASASYAYVLADRGTWLSFKNKGDLDIVMQGDKRLFNQYGVMLVNPARHPHVKKDLGQRFIDWLVSAEGQRRHRGLQDQRQAAVLPQRWRSERVNRFPRRCGHRGVPLGFCLTSDAMSEKLDLFIRLFSLQRSCRTLASPLIPRFRRRQIWATMYSR